MTDINNLEPGPIAVRLAIREVFADGNPSLIRLVTIDGGTGISLEMSPSDPRGESIERCAHEVVSTAAADAGLPLQERLEAFVSRLSMVLTASGLNVDRLPDADFVMRFELDFETGLIVGQHETLNPFSVADEGVPGRVMAAVKDAFSKDRGLATSIVEKTERGDHGGAAATALGEEARATALLCRSSHLMDAMLRIDRDALADSVRNELLLRIASLAGLYGHHLQAGNAAEELLMRGGDLDEQIRFSLQNQTAIAALHRGEKEFALSTWRALLRSGDRISAAERAWVWRNLSMALDPGCSEALQAAECSVDAFLEAGDNRQATISLKQLSRLQEDAEPSSAITQYEKMLALLDRKGVLNGEMRANILHRKARKLLDLRSLEEAYLSAIKAVELRRGLLGAEEQLIASLHLAIITADQAGDHDTAERLRTEACALEEKSGSVHFAFARRVKALMDEFDATEASALLKEAEEKGDPDLLAGAGTVAIINDPRISSLQKIRQLESLLRKLQKIEARKQTMHPVRLAIAQVMQEEGEYQRSAAWYRTIITDTPLDVVAHQSLVDVLWKSNDWGAAAIVLRGQLDRFGEAPGRLYAYGRSLFEAGDMSGAVLALSKACALLDEPSDLRAMAMNMRERAFALGATVLPEVSSVNPTVPVTIAEVDRALRSFAQFISSVKRMEFWQRPKGAKSHKWIDRPEARGQTLLHTFVQALFGERVAIFEELATGAGRLDLLLRFAGGLSVIIELKMCGAPYTTTYAISGEDQIHHYMENRRTFLGFLVVFDGRARDAGNPLLTASGAVRGAVTEILIDVRPTVKDIT